MLVAVESHFKPHKTPFVAANTASRLLPSQYLLLRSEGMSTMAEAMPTQRAASTSWAYVEKVWRAPFYKMPE